MNRTCTSCRHPERHDIEAALKASTPYRDMRNGTSFKGRDRSTSGPSFVPTYQDGQHR
jgi:hypothetical protein